MPWSTNSSLVCRQGQIHASQPIHDTQFLRYVTNPFLPVLLNNLFGGAAVVPDMPRGDLVAAFLTE